MREPSFSHCAKNGEWNEISFCLNKQAMFICLRKFGRPEKAILLEVAVNVVTYSPIQVPWLVMMGYWSRDPGPHYVVLLPD